MQHFIGRRRGLWDQPVEEVRNRVDKRGPGRRKYLAAQADRHRVFATRQRGTHRAGNTVREIVVLPGRVVDGIATGTRGAPLEAAELGNQTIIVGEVEATGIHRRKQIDVKLRLVLVGGTVLDTALAERLPTPFTGVAVAAR